jgi:hypothetical protein
LRRALFFISLLVEGIDADGTAPGALWSNLTKWMKNLRNNFRTTFQIVSKKVNKKQLIKKTKQNIPVTL